MSSWEPLSTKLVMLLDSGMSRADKTAIIILRYSRKIFRPMQLTSSVSSYILVVFTLRATVYHSFFSSISASDQHLTITMDCEAVGQVIKAMEMAKKILPSYSLVTNNTIKMCFNLIDFLGTKSMDSLTSTLTDKNLLYR